MNNRTRVATAQALAGLLLFTACTSGTVSETPAGTVSETPAGTTGPTSDGTTESLYEGHDGETLVLASGALSGALETALRESVIPSFEERTGATVGFSEGSDNTVASLEAMSEAGNVTWDVIGGQPATVLQLTQLGLIQPLDPRVPVDLLRDGGYGEYFIAFVPYASPLIFNTDAFPEGGDQPATVEDLYDLERFPGNRCLYNAPQLGGVLESAALASGADPDSLYPIDVDAAFDALDTIKDSTILWDSSAQAMQLLISGECSMGLVWNGPAYAAYLEAPDAPIALSFQNVISAQSTQMIAADAPNPELANAFLAWMIEDRESQRIVLEATAYELTPRKDALDIPPEIARFAAIGDAADQVILEDPSWYAANLPELLDRWTLWLLEE